MRLKMIAAAAATFALSGAAAAQPSPPADGLPPLNSGVPSANLPPLQGAPVAATGTGTDAAAQVGLPDAADGDPVKDALGRQIGKMGQTGAPTMQPLGMMPDLGKDAGTPAQSLIRPGSGLTSFSGQSSIWIPK